MAVFLDQYLFQGKVAKPFSEEDINDLI